MKMMLAKTEMFGNNLKEGIKPPSALTIAGPDSDSKDWCRMVLRAPSEWKVVDVDGSVLDEDQRGVVSEAHCGGHYLFPCY